jgi:hypothetical protein
MLKVDWYLEQPLDFEYKNYILLDYIQSVDKSYQIHQLSPYLLWTERLIDELKDFDNKRRIFHKSIQKTQLIFDDGIIRLMKKTIEVPESIKLITEIIDYSCPILESKIKLGYKLLNKYPQILF